MPEESLAERVKRFREQTQAGIDQRRLDAKYSRSARARADIATAGRFTFQVSQAALWMRDWILMPIVNLIVCLCARLKKIANWIWAFCVYRRTKDGVLIFSKTRAGITLFSFLFFCYYLAIPLADLAFDSVLYAFTVHHNEELYLFASQEIDPDTGLHNIEGADHAPWTDQDSTYFRAENSLFANLWSLTHNRWSLWPPHFPLYYPEYVGAAIPTGTSHCFVTTYGVRIRLPWLKNKYGYILSVSCTPMNIAAPAGIH